MTPMLAMTIHAKNGRGWVEYAGSYSSPDEYAAVRVSRPQCKCLWRLCMPAAADVDSDVAQILEESGHWPGVTAALVEAIKSTLATRNVTLVKFNPAVSKPKPKPTPTQVRGPVEHKRCSGCKEVLPRDAFYKKSTGLTPRCKPCTSMAKKQQRQQQMAA